MMRCLFRLVVLYLVMVMAPEAARAAVALRDGALWVDGRPFYLLSTWGGGAAPEELARLGLNADFRGAGRSEEAVAETRRHLRACGEHGLRLIPYLGYGGTGVNPWPKEAVERQMALASEPALLAWYIGDDLDERHLPGMQATAAVIHAHDRSHPVVADYIADPMEILRSDLRPSLDILCQYFYPIPETPLRDYGLFFDTQRARFGAPMWTWIQAFMWDSTGQKLQLGREGPSAIPEPEQVRLMSYVAVGHGVRGLLFFQMRVIEVVPEYAAEIALITREIRLVEPYLAAGHVRQGIPTTAPDVVATEYRYQGGSAVSLVTYGENYHRWVDDGVRKEVAFEVAAPRGKTPRALLLSFPEPVECRVAPAQGHRVRVVVPSLELAGLVLLTADEREVARVRREMGQFRAQAAPFVVGGAAAQVRKVAHSYWLLGRDPVGGNALLREAQRDILAAQRALRVGDDTGALARARQAMRLCRQVIDKTMHFAQEREALVPEPEQVFLKTFYSLPHITGLGEARADGEARWVREWMVIGPFPLEMVEQSAEVVPAGFERAYPPEQGVDLGGRYDGMASPVRWQPARANVDARVDLLRFLAPSENAVAYATATITAPREMQTTLGLGSNDGAKVWLNGELIHAEHVGRESAPDMDLLAVTLRAGENRLLLKIENWGLNWDFYVSVRDPERALRFEAR